MTESTTGRRPSLLSGLGLWTLFAFFALALRGVRWDENYEFAQALDPAFGYPDWHPLYLYVRNVYNAQIHFSALLAQLTDSPAFLNGFRNLGFILATVLPPFILGAVLSGRALGGHLCAVLVLAGVHLEFDGTYPQFVWPGMFSNGHIGTGFALATAGLFAGGYLRTASLMLGLMPMIHLGQWPPLILLASVLAVVAVKRGQWAVVKYGMPFFAVGLLACFVYWLIQRQLAVPVAVEPQAVDIWRGIVQHHDMHRRIPIGNSRLVPLMLAPLAVGGWLLLSPSSRAWNFTCIYAAGVAGIVYGIVALHFGLGGEMPYFLIGWLHYRLANHLPILLIAFAVALLLLQRTSIPIVVVLSFLAVRPLLGYAMNEATFDRYFSAADSVLFALAGAAAASALSRLSDRVETITLAAMMVLTLSILAVMHQFGAACYAAGAVLGWFLSGLDREESRFTLLTTATASSVIMTTVLAIEFGNRTHLPVGDFEGSIATYLRYRGEETAMLVGPPYQLMLQAQTNHPVMSDMATHYHVSYMPALAPRVHKMYQEIYGIDLRRPEDSQPGWRSVWAARTAEEWRSLAEDYGFDYVIGPAALMPLEIVYEGERNSLYRIPPATSSEAATLPTAPAENAASGAPPATQTTDPD